MSDALVGRGLYPFVGASTDSKSPTSDSAASTWPTKPLPGQRAFETNTLDLYEFDGLTWLKIRGTGSDGSPAESVRVRDIGPITQSRNRNLVDIAEGTYADATNSATWPAANNIREITILVTATDSATAPPVGAENYVLASFNAATEAIAIGWLDPTLDSATDDVQFEKFLIGERVTFRFTSPLTKLSLLPVDVSTTLSLINAFVGAH